MRHLIFCTVVGFLVSVAWQASADDAVVRLLQGYEWELPEAELRSLGSDVDERLAAVSRDSGQPNFIRERAAMALTAFSSEPGWQVFVDRLREDQADTVRRHAATNLCRTFLTSNTAAVSEQLVPLLKSGDPHLRVRAARCLQNVELEFVEAAVKDYQKDMAENWELDRLGVQK